MHVPAATVTAEVGKAKAQSLSYVVLLAATTAMSGFLFGFDTTVINGVLLLLRRQFALSNTFTFLSLVKILNLWGTFATYAALSCHCCIFVWKMVHETKSRTLKLIQETFST